MKRIIIDTIPHKSQRYETAGDYFDTRKESQVFVSDLGSDSYEFLIAVHELVEQFLCRHRGIKEKDITDFDLQFEEERRMGLHSKDAEPGDAPDAPYRKEHFTATNIERILAAEIGVDWECYDRAVDSLYNGKTIRRKVR